MRRSPASTFLVALCLAVASSLAVLPDAATAEDLAANFKFFDFKANDSAVLKANIIEPAAAGTAKTPAILFVNSWGLNDLEYLAQATKLSKAGYTVMSYTTRGFWLSGGAIETAGPLDIADVTSAIDWMVANSRADPTKIGVAGVSYGAGISLISSAFDARIKAVCALSGWADLVESLLGYNTRRPQAAFLLKFAAEVLGKPSAGLSGALDNYFGNKDLDVVRVYGKVRSAATYIDKINANNPAILMANAYGDSLFPPNQLVDFFGKLTSSKKRLEFAPGDHIIPEALGLAGLPNHVWDSLTRWFNYHLTGAANGINTEPKVHLRLIGGSSTDVSSYNDWSAVTSSRKKFFISSVNVFTGTGSLDTSSSTWTHKIWTGVDTVAGGGVALLTGTITGLTGILPKLWLPLVDRLRGAVWMTDAFSADTKLRGITKLSIPVQPPAGVKGTIVAYIYDVDALGTGTLITFVPYSWAAASATGSAITIAIDFPTISYNIGKGHRFALVVDTKDPLYYDDNGSNDALIFSGGASSFVDLPINTV